MGDLNEEAIDGVYQKLWLWFHKHLSDPVWCLANGIMPSTGECMAESMSARQEQFKIACVNPVGRWLRLWNWLFQAMESGEVLMAMEEAIRIRGLAARVEIVVFEALRRKVLEEVGLRPWGEQGTKGRIDARKT